MARQKANLIVDLTEAVMSVMNKDQLPRLVAAIEDVAHTKEGAIETVPMPL
jgi:phenylpyruvate tautomerase PptA (4-oxalocrotonate tautomerase family)